MMAQAMCIAGGGDDGCKGGPADVPRRNNGGRRSPQHRGAGNGGGGDCPLRDDGTDRVDQEKEGRYHPEKRCKDEPSLGNGAAAADDDDDPAADASPDDDIGLLLSRLVSMERDVRESALEMVRLNARLDAALSENEQLRKYRDMYDEVRVELELLKMAKEEGLRRRREEGPTSEGGRNEEMSGSREKGEREGDVEVEWGMEGVRNDGDDRWEEDLNDDSSRRGEGGGGGSSGGELLLGFGAVEIGARSGKRQDNDKEEEIQVRHKKHLRRQRQQHVQAQQQRKKQEQQQSQRKGRVNSAGTLSITSALSGSISSLNALFATSAEEEEQEWVRVADNEKDDDKEFAFIVDFESDSRNINDGLLDEVARRAVAVPYSNGGSNGGGGKGERGGGSREEEEVDITVASTKSGDGGLGGSHGWEGWQQHYPHHKHHDHDRWQRHRPPSLVRHRSGGAISGSSGGGRNSRNYRGGGGGGEEEGKSRRRHSHGSLSGPLRLWSSLTNGLLGGGNGGSGFKRLEQRQWGAAMSPLSGECDNNFERKTENRTVPAPTTSASERESERRRRRLSDGYVDDKDPAAEEEDCCHFFSWDDARSGSKSESGDGNNDDDIHRDSAEEEKEYEEEEGKASSRRHGRSPHPTPPREWWHHHQDVDNVDAAVHYGGDDGCGDLHWRRQAHPPPITSNPQLGGASPLQDPAGGTPRPSLPPPSVGQDSRGGDAHGNDETAPERGRRWDDDDEGDRDGGDQIGDGGCNVGQGDGKDNGIGGIMKRRDTAKDVNDFMANLHDLMDDPDFAGFADSDLDDEEQ